MSRRALLLALAAAFITGSAVGLMGGILFARHSLFPHRAEMRHGRGLPEGPPGPEGRGPGRRRGGPSAEDVVERLTDELSLSDSQSERILALVTASRGAVQSERDSLHARIGRELTTDQRRRWEALPRPHRFPGPPPGFEPGRH